MKAAIVFASLLFPIAATLNPDAVQNEPIKTVKIFDKVWMAENLNVSTYRNGDPIPEIQDEKEWKKAKTGAWCYYENKTENGTVYGKMYNWIAVHDPRGLAPEGFHIPSEEEWSSLAGYDYATKGTDGKRGKELKSKTGWKDYGSPKKPVYGNGDDTYGFNGLPGGYRNLVGVFQRINEQSYWWCTKNQGIQAWCFDVNGWTGIVGRGVDSQKCGFYVRCIKD